MRNNYLTNPDFTYEKVNRASSACGPMVKWAIAQLGYADMIRRVEPLRTEMRSLEMSADVAKAKSEEVDQVGAKAVSQKCHSVCLSVEYKRIFIRYEICSYFYVVDRRFSVSFVSRYHLFCEKN